MKPQAETEDEIALGVAIKLRGDYWWRPAYPPEGIPQVGWYLFTRTDRSPRGVAICYTPVPELRRALWQFLHHIEQGHV